MANCCSSSLNLGCVNNCDNIDMGVLAPQTGTYTIEIVPGGGLFQVTLDNTDQLSFTAQNFREDSCTVFQILQPDGTYYTSGVNDCFIIDVQAAGALSTTTGNASPCDDYELELGGVT